MTNINLTTKEEQIETSFSAKDWSSLFLVGIISALVYLGAFSYHRWLNQDMEKKNKEYTIKHNALLEKGKSVFDFQNRLETAKTLVAEKNYALEILGKVEETIIPEVYLESFDFNTEEGWADLNFVTKEYRLVANQIASLKKIDYFSEVQISETKTRDDGKINFPLKLIIKK